MRSERNVPTHAEFRVISCYMSDCVRGSKRLEANALQRLWAFIRFARCKMTNALEPMILGCQVNELRQFNEFIT